MKNVPASDFRGSTSKNGVPALLGGVSEFSEQIVVGRPNMPDRSAYLSRIESMLDSQRLTNLGPMSIEFEERVAEISGAKFGVAVCNATIGLEVAISAVGMKGEVIVPSFTFIATVHALWRQGIKPVFCDVDPATHTLDPEQVRRAITPSTTGILGVSLWGQYAGAGELRGIADAHGLSFLLDSAHSFGCTNGIGADAEVFSFHATKCIHSIEGGVIVTDDQTLAEKLRLMVNFGFEGEDTVAHLGTNAKMSEPASAMGLTSLEGRRAVFDHNLRNHAGYVGGLSGIAGLSILAAPTPDRHNHQYVVVEVDEVQAGLDRDELVAALRFENVLARRYFHPGCHRMAPYRDLFPDARATLRQTEALCERVMVLPNGLAVEPNDVRRLTDRIKAILARPDEIRAALATTKDSRLPGFLRIMA